MASNKKVATEKDVRYALEFGKERLIRTTGTPVVQLTHWRPLPSPPLRQAWATPEDTKTPASDDPKPLSVTEIAEANGYRPLLRGEPSREVWAQMLKEGW